ncbi:hypothetical protein ACQ86G_25040 [Roseateles chitinivorans]|uniref:hypothetical protein n=1 Tax=Roseateles chitinivorans TaxID=2917965 RepID=UPI003D672957
MMLPSHYTCTSCGENFEFATREARYHFNRGGDPLGSQISGAKVFHAPLRPGWCKDCATICTVEDIATIRAFEDAYGAVKAGRAVEYPAETENLTREMAMDEVGAFLRWRLERRHAPRALCCGGSNYQLLDVPQPLLKHAGCDFGVIEPRYFMSGPYNGPGPGAYGPANFPLLSEEGDLIGLLTWFDQETGLWKVTAAEYPVHDQD